MSINQLRNRWGVEIDASEDLKTIQQHLLSDQLVVVRNSTFANYTKFSDFVHNIGYMLGECCGRSVDETGVNTSPIVQVANPNQNDVPSGGFSYMGKGSGYWHQDGATNTPAFIIILHCMHIMYRQLVAIQCLLI